jgi:hypothetical protein
MPVKHEAISQGTMSLPPTAVAAITLAGVSLQDWVLIATLGWLAVQFGWFIVQRYREFKKGGASKDAK